MVLAACVESNNDRLLTALAAEQGSSLLLCAIRVEGRSPSATPGRAGDSLQFSDGYRLRPISRSKLRNKLMKSRYNIRAPKMACLRPASVPSLPGAFIRLIFCVS